MEISSNWSSENGIKLHDIIQDSDTLPDGDLADLLNEDKCISLVRRPQDSCKDCTLRFTPTKNLFPVGKATGPVTSRKKCLSGLKILSEARVVELCLGIHGEYHSTVHGTMMGDFGDSKIYTSEIKFDVPQDVVLVKLKGMCLDGSIWIYGLHVVYVAETRPLGVESVGSYFTHEHLSPLLKGRGIRLSKDADRFRQLLEGYNRSGDGHDKRLTESVNNPMALMSMMFGARKPRALSNDCELDVKNGNECGEENVQISKLLSVIGNKSANGNGTELNSILEKEIVNNLQNETEFPLDNQNKANMFDHRSQVLSSDRGKSSGMTGISQSMTDFIDRFQSLSADGKMYTKESKKLGSILDMISKSGSPPACVSELPDNSYVSHQNEKTNDKTEIKCVCGSEEFLNKVERIVEKKLEAMENRLIERIEEKFEKVEQLLTKISKNI